VGTVRHDRSNMLARGVFTLHPKEKLDAWNIHDGGTVLVNFRGPETLQPEDLRVIHAVAAAGFAEYRARNGAKLVSPKDERGVVARLELKGDRDVEVTDYQTSLRELAEVAGMDRGGDGLTAIFKSLQRITEVTVWTYVEAPPGTPSHLTKKVEIEVYGETRILRCSSVESSRLLHAITLKGNGGLRIALNPRETVALLGQGRNFTEIDMREVQKIRGDGTALLHARMCAFIDHGSSKIISLHRLEEYVYGDILAINANPSDLKVRRRMITRSLSELERIGWVVMKVKDSWRITRPIRPDLDKAPPGGS